MINPLIDDKKIYRYIVSTETFLECDEQGFYTTKEDNEKIDFIQEKNLDVARKFSLNTIEIKADEVNDVRVSINELGFVTVEAGTSLLIDDILKIDNITIQGVNKKFSFVGYSNEWEAIKK